MAAYCVAFFIDYTIGSATSKAICKNTPLGKNYAGILSTTISGRSCMSWTGNSPHVPKSSLADNQFPDGSIAAANNYCRNPDDEPNGPWCYTTDPDKRWEYCDVPYCPHCKNSDLGIEYAGNASVTASGRGCQAWTATSPQKPTSLDDSKFPDGSKAAAKNYCRNPDSTAGGPWCYTLDPNKRWEVCAVPLCPICKITKQGKEYKGKTSTTVSGRTCQVWTSKTPQVPRSDLADSQFPDGSIAAANNYCRNPDGEPDGPWCYTTDPDKRWEYCDVPYCR